jgi:2-C-methyl-D-erythritol 4-phosphate cytidylyltransferase / 2-C-methyl-D-erythritol 2,4-cyclodiphosphate synthase
VASASAGLIVTAGGRGTRFGGLKQFETLAGRSVLARAIQAGAGCAVQVVVVVPAGEEARARQELAGLGLSLSVVAGGETRALSVRAGLAALDASLPLVAIHDGVRPLATRALFERVLAAAAETGAAIPGMPCAETVKRVEGGRVVETVDRSALRLVQTPQAFRTQLLRDAYAKLGDRAAQFTDEAGLVEAAGFPVAVVAGEAENVKITEPRDLEDAARKLEAATRPRIGFGYDVHPFAAGRKLILGGVEFPGDGLQGHSDADVVTHAVTDAVLGAAGLGDLGHHFPDTDPTFKGADSLGLLRAAVAKARELGLRVENVDLTIAARRPKIAPAALSMRTKLAEALGVPIERVNVKATTGEGLGFVGREEGIAVQAVALLWTS